MATLNNTALGSNDTSGTSLGTADALSVTAGDLIYVIFKYEGAVDTFTGSSCTGGGLTFAVAADEFFDSLGDLGLVTFYATATSTTTITPTVASASRSWRRVQAYSFTPAASTTLGLGNMAAAEGGSSTTPSTGAASATAAGVAIGAFALYASADFTATGSGFSEAAEFDAAGAAALRTVYQLQTGAGSLTSAPTLDTSTWWIASLVIFNESGGGSPITDGPKLVSVRSNIRFN
jgi:hypothetical protein